MLATHVPLYVTETQVILDLQVQDESYHREDPFIWAMHLFDLIQQVLMICRLQELLSSS